MEKLKKKPQHFKLSLSALKCKKCIFDILKKPFANIGILLLLIIALPPLFFTSYEVGNYYQNEQMIDSIYTSQLESVIFSINQYSDDVVSGWANRLEQNLQKPGAAENVILDDFIKRNVAIEAIFLADSSAIRTFYERSPAGTAENPDKKMFQDLLLENNLLIRRLIQYLEGNYRKIQPFDIALPNKSLLIFTWKKAGGEIGICGIVVDTKTFIRENLGPKIQSVAQEKFFLSVFEIASDAEVYSNEFHENSDKNIEHKQVLWLMPDYELGIQLRGETIEDMVNDRMWSGIWLIVLMDFILFLAAIFVYRAIRQQIKLAQLKSEFVSNVSHEIRTPLAVINMYSETLEMGRVKDEAKKREYYKIIHTETNRLSGIVNKILNFSKIESGKRSYKFVETNINELLSHIIETYQHHFKNKNMECRFFPAADLPSIMLDPEAVTDAVINLIDNAIKYSGERKEIEISSGRTSSLVFVKVKDYGLGIDEKYHKMVFDKFYRVTSGNLAHKAKGTGIGLSIVKHIAAAHGGSVSLESSLGRGSTFRLDFPFNQKIK